MGGVELQQHVEQHVTTKLIIYLICFCVIKKSLNGKASFFSFLEKMKKIFPYEAGKTLDSHKEFLRKLTKRGAKKVELDKSDVTIVFCPIVSRYETDINSALSSATGKPAHTQMHMYCILFFIP